MVLVTSPNCLWHQSRFQWLARRNNSLSAYIVCQLYSCFPTRLYYFLIIMKFPFFQNYINYIVVFQCDLKWGRSLGLQGPTSCIYTVVHIDCIIGSAHRDFVLIKHFLTNLRQEPASILLGVRGGTIQGLYYNYSEEYQVCHGNYGGSHS